MIARWASMLAIIAGVMLVVWFSLPDASVKVRDGNAAIDFSLPDLSGELHSLPKGEVVLLNFWATWCPPCRKEMPSMAALHRKLADRGLKIVAVSIDRNRDDLRGFAREYDLPFLVLHDADSSVSRDYGVFRYPESFLIDRQGQIREHKIGAVEWMSPPIIQTIEGMLSEPGSRQQG